MGTPAVVAGDPIQGTCAIHQVPSPSGAPVPAGPLPFSAPVTQGLAVTVTIEGKPAAVAGASGLNTPPHVGLHATDPFVAPVTQAGQIVSGSASVFFDGLPAAYTGCGVTICAQAPGTITGSSVTVTVGA